MFARMAEPMNAAERVRARIQDWFSAQGWGSKTVLANEVLAKFGGTRSRSWVTGLITRSGKRQDLRLRDLDAVADAMGIQPGQLVQRFDRVWLDATMEEDRMLRYFRALPDEIRASLVTIADFLLTTEAAGAMPSQAEDDLVLWWKSKGTLDAHAAVSVLSRYQQLSPQHRAAIGESLAELARLQPQPKPSRARRAARRARSKSSAGGVG